MLPQQHGPYLTQAARRDRNLPSIGFSRAPTAIGICDADGRFLQVNASLATLLHRAPGQIIGRPFLVFVHPAERAASLACYFNAVVAAAARQPFTAERCELRCLTGASTTIRVCVTWTVTEPDECADQYGIVHLAEVAERP